MSCMSEKTMVETRPLGRCYDHTEKIQMEIDQQRIQQAHIDLAWTKLDPQNLNSLDFYKRSSAVRLVAYKQLFEYAG